MQYNRPNLQNVLHLLVHWDEAAAVCLSVDGAQVETLHIVRLRVAKLMISSALRQVRVYSRG